MKQKNWLHLLYWLCASAQQNVAIFVDQVNKNLPVWLESKN